MSVRGPAPAGENDLRLDYDTKSFI